MGAYSIIIPHETLTRTSDYLHALRLEPAKAGARLQRGLHGTDLLALDEYELLGKLFDTKQPKIYAESEVVGDGSDWNLIELGLLGDVSVAVPVTIFDDGTHSAPNVHAPAFSGMLVFTPGALLRNEQHYEPADWRETTNSDGQLSTEGYYELYRRRLLPVFRYINEHAQKARSALVTVPGMGCGQFAGPFRGQLGQQLRAVLERLLTDHGETLLNLKAIYFDPYNEGASSRSEIHGVSLMTRPLCSPGNHLKSQLCPPVVYAEQGDDFSQCGLYSIVAWDHVSWPGNDFFMDSRTTDDGVKAAATSSMCALTGVEGQYDARLNKYQPPSGYANWSDVVNKGLQTRSLRLWRSTAIWRPV